MVSQKARFPLWLRPYIPTIEGIVALLHPYLEAVVHDIGRDQIVAIWNPYSGRKIGDPSLLDEIPAGDKPLQGPYEKVSVEGHPLTSVSSVLVDAEHKDRGLLCINFDRAPFIGAADLLSSFALPKVDRPRELFERDWREQIALEADSFCRERQLARERLTRTQRIELLRDLDDQGLFQTRNAAEHAGKAMGISRASVYALLKEARS